MNISWIIQTANIIGNNVRKDTQIRDHVVFCHVFFITELPFTYQGSFQCSK
ncbi:hypothetical protein MA16_Dca010833 [Dendrobium catenatum]|uniref:Uncharacterized protein n=1 Tax=Dendrobium catenatum TaxID=906689 RepID=A0A2I0W5C1_9ASPA|nr:hypothetical protein MA16_Dca010833 [Dendrobium catenatum]